MSLRCSLENYFLFNGDSLGEGRLEWVCGLREEGGVYGEIYERSVREREMERERERERGRGIEKFNSPCRRDQAVLVRCLGIASCPIVETFGSHSTSALRKKGRKKERRWSEKLNMETNEITYNEINSFVESYYGVYL